MEFEMHKVGSNGRVTFPSGTNGRSRSSGSNSAERRRETVSFIPKMRDVAELHSSGQNIHAADNIIDEAHASKRSTCSARYACAEAIQDE